MAGTCENMSAFPPRLCGKTGFKLPFYVNSNSTKKARRDSDPVTDAAVEIFKHDNSLDCQLPEHVKKRIDNEIREQGHYR